MVTYSLAILNQAVTFSVSSLRERSLLWTQKTTAYLFQEVKWKVSHTDCIFSYFHISWKLYCMSIRDKNSRSDISHRLPFPQWAYREAWTPVHHGPMLVGWCLLMPPKGAIHSRILFWPLVSCGCTWFLCVQLLRLIKHHRGVPLLTLHWSFSATFLTSTSSLKN